MKPDKYSLNLNEEWKFVSELEDYSDDFDKEKCQMSINIEERPIQIEWFPNSNELKVETSVSLDEQTSKEYGIFGLVCMRLILTGSNWMKEL